MSIVDKGGYKILPYGVTMIKTWPEDCFLFSVLSRTKFGNNWIADSNIQIVLTRGLVMYFPFRKQHLFQNGFDDIPLIHKYVISRKLLYSIHKDFCDIIKKSIDENYYISGLFNRKVLLEDVTGNLNHVCYIYGYDENVVYMNDNFYHGKNSCEKIPFDRVQRAFEAALSAHITHLGNGVINFYEVNTDMEYQLSKEKIKNGMMDYLYGTCNKENRNDEDTHFGVKAYEKLASMIEHADNNDIELRNISFLRDIARVNEIRVMTMMDSGMFEINNSSLSQNIEKQVKSSEIMLGLAMKYMAGKNEKIIHRLANLIREFGKTEEKIACTMIELC